MTTHRALNEAPRPTSPGSRGGRDTEGAATAVTIGRRPCAAADQTATSAMRTEDPAWNGPTNTATDDITPRDETAAPTGWMRRHARGQTRAAGEHRAGSSRLGPAAIAQGVGDHEGGQIVGQHNIGDSCEPVRPALGAQPQASRSTHLPCGIPRLCPTADDTGAGTPYRPTDDRERQLHLG